MFTMKNLIIIMKNLIIIMTCTCSSKLKEWLDPIKHFCDGYLIVITAIYMKHRPNKAWMASIPPRANNAKLWCSFAADGVSGVSVRHDAPETQL